MFSLPDFEKKMRPTRQLILAARKLGLDPEKVLLMPEAEVQGWLEGWAELKEGKKPQKRRVRNRPNRKKRKKRR